MSQWEGSQEIGLSKGQTSGTVRGEYIERPAGVSPSQTYIPGNTVTEVKVERNEAGRPVSFNLYKYDQYGNLMSVGTQRAGAGNPIMLTPPSRITQEQASRYNAFQEREYQQDSLLAMGRIQSGLQPAPSPFEIGYMRYAQGSPFGTGYLTSPEYQKEYPSTPLDYSQQDRAQQYWGNLTPFQKGVGLIGGSLVDVRGVAGSYFQSKFEPSERGYKERLYELAPRGKNKTLMGAGQFALRGLTGEVSTTGLMAFGVGYGLSVLKLSPMVLKGLGYGAIGLQTYETGKSLSRGKYGEAITGAGMFAASLPFVQAGYVAKYSFPSLPKVTLFRPTGISPEYAKFSGLPPEMQAATVRQELISSIRPSKFSFFSRSPAKTPYESYMIPEVRAESLRTELIRGYQQPGLFSRSPAKIPSFSYLSSEMQAETLRSELITSVRGRDFSLFSPSVKPIGRYAYELPETQKDILRGELIKGYAPKGFQIFSRSAPQIPEYSYLSTSQKAFITKVEMMTGRGIVPKELYAFKKSVTAPQMLQQRLLVSNQLIIPTRVRVKSPIYDYVKEWKPEKSILRASYIGIGIPALIHTTGRQAQYTSTIQYTGQMQPLKPITQYTTKTIQFPISSGISRDIQASGQLSRQLQIQRPVQLQIQKQIQIQERRETTRQRTPILSREQFPELQLKKLKFPSSSLDIFPSRKKRKGKISAFKFPEISRVAGASRVMRGIFAAPKRRKKARKGKR